MENLILLNHEATIENHALQDRSNVSIGERNHVHEKQSLLLISNDRIFQYKTQLRLGAKYKINTVKNIDEGILLLKNSKPDAIIFDESRKNTDGSALIKLIRKNINTKHSVLIFVLKELCESNELKLLNHGVDDIFLRAINMDLFELKLKRLIYYKQFLKSNINENSILEPADVEFIDGDEKFLKKLVGLVEDHISNNEFNVEIIVREIGVSRSKLYSKLKELTGMSSTQFVRHIRIKKAMKFMQNGSHTIKEIRSMSGFKSDSYFTKCFKKEYGEVPYKYLSKYKRSKKFSFI